METEWEYHVEGLVIEGDPRETGRLDPISQRIDEMRRAGWTLSSVVAEATSETGRRYLLTFRRLIREEQ